ncbi:hypothetical protein OLZ31_26670 [Enterobacter asburiae]|nr:hypothetical protein [Enterobacter asburiae]
MKKTLLSFLIAAASPSFAIPQDEEPVVGCEEVDYAAIEEGFNDRFKKAGRIGKYRLSKFKRIESSKSAYICTFIATDEAGQSRKGGIFVSMPPNERGFFSYFSE